MRRRRRIRRIRGRVDEDVDGREQVAPPIEVVRSRGDASSPLGARVGSGAQRDDECVCTHARVDVVVRVHDPQLHCRPRRVVTVDDRHEWVGAEAGAGRRAPRLH